MNRQHPLTLTLIGWLAQPQNLRAATSASYIERGHAWFAKGDWARGLYAGH